MFGWYLVAMFLCIYLDQHGPYLNILDVVLMSTAAIFGLFVIMALIISWKDR